MRLLPLLLAALMGACNTESPVSPSPTSASPTRASPISPSPTAPTPTSPVGVELFDGFFPVGTAQEARDLQDRADGAKPPMRGDPLMVAIDAGNRFCGWDPNQVEVRIISESGSAAEGWEAEVSLTPTIGEDPDNGIPGPEHRVRLIGLENADRPVWFVSAISSPEVVVDEPAEGAFISSPVRVAGQGIGFEGTIETVVLDDSGEQLHPRPDQQEGFVDGGVMEVAPFEGELNFNPASSPQGVLVFKSSTPVGPYPNCTAQRVAFEE